ncbi:MAG: Uma2 family endonuclease [Chloroflexota bacterium]
MVISDKVYTPDEFLAYQAEHDERLLELRYGRIAEKVTSEKHGYIVINIGSALKIWLRQSDLTGFYSTEVSVKIDDENIRRPDVSFRFTDGDVSEATTLSEMPAFLVEVVSPSNSLSDLREKARFYIEHGAKLVWVVYPAKQIVDVYTAGGDVDVFTAEDTLSGGDVLAAFEMTVKALFEI